MLFQIIVFILLGTIIGTITGLIPGIHINLIGAFLISLVTTNLFFFNTTYLIVFITAMAITHTFIDFIPSILIGSPDTDTELSVLPGHLMLKKGKGYEAVLLATYGSFIAIILFLILTFPLIIFLQKSYVFIEKIIPYFLIFILVLLIFMEKRKFNAFFVVLLTGVLGLCVLNLEKLNQPLLPLLTGLFGSSTLIISIKNKINIPKQKITKPKRFFRLKPIIGSLISAPVCCFIPGIGASQAAIIGNTITRNKKDIKGFLILLGATNTLVMALSFITIYPTSRTRTGAAVAIKEISGIIDIKIIFLLIITILISGVIAYHLTKKIGKISVKKLNKINYQKISLTTLIILTIIILIVSKIIGLFVFMIATLTGIYCISLKVRRTNMMACLIIPTIIFYLML